MEALQSNSTELEGIRQILPELERMQRNMAKLLPNVATVWALLGFLLHTKLSRFDEAEQAYRKAIEIDPQNAQGWTSLGDLLHEKLSRLDEAEQAYRRAIEIDPKDTRAWTLLGQLLHEERSRFDEAEEAYRKAIEIDPKNACAWASLGMLLNEKLSRSDESERAFRRAIEIKPQCARASWPAKTATPAETARGGPPIRRNRHFAGTRRSEVVEQIRMGTIPDRRDIVVAAGLNVGPEGHRLGPERRALSLQARVHPMCIEQARRCIGIGTKVPCRPKDSSGHTGARHGLACGLGRPWGGARGPCRFCWNHRLGTNSNRWPSGFAFSTAKMSMWPWKSRRSVPTWHGGSSGGGMNCRRASDRLP